MRAPAEPEELCAAACVSRRCNALACAPALYARLSFGRLTPKRDGQPRAVDDAALALLCRRAGASLRFLDICDECCRGITHAGLEAALQGVDRGVLELRVSPRPSGLRGVSLMHGRFAARIRFACAPQHLGYFASAVDAARAYDFRARQLGKPDDWLNYPQDVAAAPPVPLP
jgi:hypothetical protein